MSGAAAPPVLGKLTKLTRAGRRRRVLDDAVWFDSQAEHRRYCELKILCRIGEIDTLQVHQSFALVVEGETICMFEPDFYYRDVAAGQWVVEDVKSPRTRVLPEYRIKKRLFEVLYGLPVRETVVGNRRPRRKRR